jgi:hypothetical protein
MNTFLDLLDTKAQLTIIADGVETSAGLHDNLSLVAHKPTSINGIEILPKYDYLAVDGVLDIPGPFYTWYHSVSGQGWLLVPNLVIDSVNDCCNRT